MTKLDLKKDDLVVKRYEDLVFMGRFLGYSRTSQGQTVALFITPERWVLGSDPSHLEKVDDQVHSRRSDISKPQEVDA